MRFIMREKLFSIGGDAYITDDNGRNAYFVDGKALALLRKLELKDMDGHVLATIQRAIALRPTFEIHEAGKFAARVVKNFFAPIVDRFTIDVPGPDDLYARGNLLQHDYTISRGGREVARISKAWISMTDRYGIDIADDQDAVLLLSVAVAIDEIMDVEEKKD